jgi:uroporphyrin-III C-methyltransferase
LTHRGRASAVTFVAGQCKGLTDQNWAGLAGADRTLVIYMGIATAPDVVEKLRADGLPAETPAAVIEKGTRSDARVLRTVLGNLAHVIVQEAIKSPALIVVGEVVREAMADEVMALWVNETEKVA